MRRVLIDVGEDQGARRVAIVAEAAVIRSAVSAMCA